MDISRLRSATASDHDSVEGSMPLMDPHLTVAIYVQVLAQLHGIVSVWEARLGLEAGGVVAALAAPRARLPLIEEDLRRLGMAQPLAAVCNLPRFESQPQLLGAMYVMEGSRLGGQLIAKHVESCLGFERGQGTRYFRGFEEQTGVMWKEFLEALKTMVPDESTEDVIAGAKKMFTAFGTWMRQSKPSESRDIVE